MSKAQGTRKPPRAHPQRASPNPNKPTPGTGHPCWLLPCKPTRTLLSPLVPPGPKQQQVQLAYGVAVHTFFRRDACTTPAGLVAVHRTEGIGLSRPLPGGISCCVKVRPLEPTSEQAAVWQAAWSVRELCLVPVSTPQSACSFAAKDPSDTGNSSRFSRALQRSS